MDWLLGAFRDSRARVQRRPVAVNGAKDRPNCGNRGRDPKTLRHKTTRPRCQPGPCVRLSRRVLAVSYSFFSVARLSAVPRMSPSVAPESEEPYWAIAS